MGALGPEDPRERHERRLLGTAIGEDHWKPPALVRLRAFAPTPVAHARLILSAFVAVILVTHAPSSRRREPEGRGITFLIRIFDKLHKDVNKVMNEE